MLDFSIRILLSVIELNILFSNYLNYKFNNHYNLSFEMEKVAEIQRAMESEVAEIKRIEAGKSIIQN